MQPTNLPSTSHHHGAVFSGAVITMAGLQGSALKDYLLDPSLKALFTESEPPPTISEELATDAKLVELRAKAHMLLAEATQALQDANQHGDSDDKSRCETLVKQALTCVTQANQTRSGQPIGMLKARMHHVSTALQAEAGSHDGNITSTSHKRHAPRLSSFVEAHPNAPQEARDLVRSTDALFAALAPQAEPEQESRISKALQTLSDAARDAARATRDGLRDAGRYIRENAEYLYDGTIRISRCAARRALGYWRDMRAATVDSYERLTDYFWPSASPLSLIASPAPRVTLSPSNERVLQGVISTLRSATITDVIEFSPGCRITASEIIGIATRSPSEFIDLSCKP